MPAGSAWDQGVRHGMKVLSVNGVPLVGSELSPIPAEPANEAVLLTSGGKELHVEMPRHAVGRGTARFSLWVLGGVWALLGAAVVLRRPDSHTARMFALFAGSAAAALAVGPSAGGPGPPWAITVQYLSVLGIGATFPQFVAALLNEQSRPRWFITSIILTGFSLIIALCFGASVLMRPSLYEIVQPVLFLYLSLAAIGSIGLLAVKGTGQQSALNREQARICLWGTVIGTLPFVSLTLIPETLGHDALLPVHITVLPFALMPIFFAYAILQHQLLGIRRLVHRGMVYGTTTIALLVLVVVASTAVVRPFGALEGSGYPYFLIPIFIVGGIIIFFPLQHGARWLVDKFLYKDTVDYQAFIQALPANVGTLSGTAEVASGIVQPLAQALNLESVYLFVNEGSGIRLVAAAGERATDTLLHVQPKIEQYMKNPRHEGLIELHLESDSFLLANLDLPGHCLGCLLLGPKHGGDILVEDEKQLVSSVVPIIALAIDKAELSEELREMNQRLLKAEETERTRIAGDLHDGPLQKAIFLAREADASLRDQKDIARQLISEIREICSRLRPAILDDLGLVPAIEWLLDGVSKRSEILTHLSLNDITEEDRFLPDIEQTLFRVTQEAINNAIKHAKATSLNVSISQVDNSLVLQVADDGVGFSPESCKKKGFGLSGMRERALSVGGSFNVHSAPGEGTIVTARIPIRAHSNDRGSTDGTTDKGSNS